MADRDRLDDAFNRANELAQLGKHEDALKAWEHAVKISPDHPIGHHARGFELAQLGRREEALAALDHALKIQPNLAMTRFLRVVRDRPRQRQTVTFRYERRRDGALVSTDEVEFTMRWFHRYELEHLMVRAGFVEIRIFGDFDRSPLAADSPAFVVVARRAAFDEDRE